MSDHFLRDKSGKVHTIVTMANIYQYGGFTFEFHRYCGPCKVNKDFEPAKRQGRKFWKAIDAWCKLSDEEKQATRISG